MSIVYGCMANDDGQKTIRIGQFETLSQPDKLLRLYLSKKLDDQYTVGAEPMLSNIEIGG